MNELFRNGCMLLGLSTLPACQTGGPVEGLHLTTGTTPVVIIAAIGKSMQKCWFKTGNPVFKVFRLANESNSYAGRPRLLLVPKNKPTGLPSLVVQAEKANGATKIQAFGPLLSTKSGQFISSDLKNWASGSSACKS